jgi:hypothetical protein
MREHDDRRNQRLPAFATFSAMKRGSAKAAT